MISPRLSNLRSLIRDENVSVFWLPNHENSGQPGTRYLSGFTGSDSHLLITKSKNYLVTDSRYLVAARKEASGCIISDVGKRSFVEVLKNVLPQSGRRNVLIDGSVVPYSSNEKIKKAIPHLTITNEDGLLKELRRVKDTAETTLLKKLYRKVAEGMF